MLKKFGPEASDHVCTAEQRPLRIAFLSYRSDPRVGGQGVYVTQAAAALARRGHSVDVLSGPPYPELGENVGLVEIPSLDLYAQPHNGHLALRPRHLRRWTDTAEYLGHLTGKFMEPWSFGERAAKYLAQRRGDYDVVIDNQSLAYGLLKIERAGLPVVGVIHHPIRRDLDLLLAQETRRRDRWLARRWYSFLAMQEEVAPQLKHVVVVSNASALDVEHCLGVSRDVITAIPLGVEQSIFRPQPEIERHPSRLLAVASADSPLKGLPILFEAYHRLLEQHPELQLHVIGRLREGTAADCLKRLNLEERVTFRSGITREELVREYAEATICVTPSLYEGFGLPAAEAMSCGAPVVVTDGGALPEVVGDTGLVAKRGSASSLAKAIASLLVDPAERLRLGDAAFRRARSQFSWDEFARRYEQVLWQAVLQKC